MATPTKPCPYCGQQVLQTAAHCGYCGKPLPAAAPAAQAQPQKTIMGYALPGAFGPGGPGFAPAPPQQPAPPPAYPPQSAPPQASTVFAQGAYPQPGQPQPQQPFAQPPMQPAAPQYPAPAGYGAPQQPQAPQPYAQQPQQPQYPQPQQPQYPQPQQPQQPQYPQPQQPQYAQPQQPQQPQYPQPQPYAQQPQQPQYPQPQPYAQQPQQPGYPQPQPAPAAAGGPAWGGGMPQSAPGTLFGIKFSLMHDQSFQNKVLGISAVALGASIVVPVSLSPFIFPFSGLVLGFFRGLLWPAVVAFVYFLVALAPKDFKAKFPPVVFKWGPFVAAYSAVGMVGFIGGGIPGLGGGSIGALGWTFPILVFGMLIRLQDPDDLLARYFVGMAALSALLSSLSMFSWMFSFGSAGGFIFGIKNLVMFAALLLCAASLVFAIPTSWVPKVAEFEHFAPIATAALILWPVLDIALTFVGALIHAHAPIMGLLVVARFLALYVGVFVVLLLTAPAAYQVLRQWLIARGVNVSVAAAKNPMAK